MRDVGVRVEPTLARPWARHRPPEAVLGGVVAGGAWCPPGRPRERWGMGGARLWHFFEGNTAMEAPAVTLLKKENAPRLWHLFTSLLETTD